MKKRISFILAVLVLVCISLVAMVGCVPEDIEPFTAADKNNAYNEIWSAWNKTNSYSGGNTIGVDLSLNAINTLDTSQGNYSIKLQAGFNSVTDSDKNAIRLVIKDNNTNIEAIDIVINKDGAYIDIAEEGATLDTELKLPDLGMTDEIDVYASIKGVFDFILTQMGTEVTIAPVLADKKAKLYDVTYTFGLDFTFLVDLLSEIDIVLGVLGDKIPPETVETIKEYAPTIIAFLDDLTVDFTITTSGNTQTKVVNPAKDAHKYTYGGGTIQSISAIGTKAGKSLKIDIGSLKLTDDIPTIAVPPISSEPSVN